MENLIDEFYARKSGELVRICDTALHRRNLRGVDAEDIVQKVTVKAWEKRRQLATHPNLMGWFVDACDKECSMLIRKDSYQRKHMGWVVPLTDNIAMDEQKDVIIRWLSHMDAEEFLSELINNMTPLEKSVYEQYYVQEKSARETAEILGLKLNTVNDAARRIRKKASSMRNFTFILFLNPIFKFFCSIFSGGRQWR